MRRVGSSVGGCGWRSARHHRRTSRNRPRGVAPSPSNLLARMPPRPSTTGIARGPASRMPRVRLPGLVRTRIKERARRRMEQSCRSQLRTIVKVAIQLALLPPNDLFRAMPCRDDTAPGAETLTNTRKIRIVDDYAELREPLVEQLA